MTSLQGGALELASPIECQNGRMDQWFCKGQALNNTFCNLGQSGRDVDIDSPQHQHDRLFLTVQHHFPFLWDPGGEGRSCRCCVQTCGVARCISSTTAVTGRSMLKAQVLHKHWTKNDHGMSSQQWARTCRSKKCQPRLFYGPVGVAIGPAGRK